MQFRTGLGYTPLENAFAKAKLEWIKCEDERVPFEDAARRVNGIFKTDVRAGRGRARAHEVKCQVGWAPVKVIADRSGKSIFRLYDFTRRYRDELAGIVMESGQRCAIYEIEPLLKGYAAAKGASLFKRRAAVAKVIKAHLSRKGQRVKL